MAARVGVLIARQGGRGRREAHDVIVTYPVIERGRRPGIHPTATPRLARLGPPRGLVQQTGAVGCAFPVSDFSPPRLAATRPRTTARDARARCTRCALA